MCGPCDGIYFLWCFSYNAPKRSLWNPALNEFMVLPDITCWKPNLPTELHYIQESYGFGYDSKANDYKVIQVLGYRYGNLKVTDNPVSILIYSLRTNSWRYWGDMDNSYQLKLNKCYVFVNGCYYWLASPRITSDWNYQMIISFDISAETCQEIPLPEFESKPDFESQLIVYQDSIAFVFVSLLPNYRTNFCIWTWNEGVWTRKLKMKLDFEVCGAFSQWRDNMLVFRRAPSKLVLFDTKTKEIYFLDDPQMGGCENICAYKESLVSINDFGKDITHNGSGVL
ncbi:F-box/kelch-repeat protein At3g23880-like [Silene latifolia]|uniref:F-box/kelch-repeat protein At3g23880-like n=1 Tax=Silene latifolia TaxID=37657 RepID=UPI003D76DA43